MPASGKGQVAPELKESIQEKSNPDSEIKSTYGVCQPVVSPEKQKVRREKAPNKKKKAFALSSHLPRPGVRSRFFYFFMETIF